MIIAVVYGTGGGKYNLAWKLIVSSSSEELKKELEEITNKRLHPQPIPNEFEAGQKISLGASKHAFARIFYTGSLPEGRLVL